MESAFESVDLEKRKRLAVWATVGSGAIMGFLMTVHESPGDWNLMVQVFGSVSLGLCVLDWCLTDARERKELITGGKRALLVLLPILGVPVYFISSRGVLGAAKAVFGLLLFGIWFSALFISTFAFTIVQMVAVPVFTRLKVF